MATQQHPAFDPNQPIVAAEFPRIGGLRKDYVGAVRTLRRLVTTSFARRRKPRRVRGAN